MMDRAKKYWPIVLVASFLGTALLVVAIFYFSSQSEPAKMAVQVLRDSPVAHEVLGNIEKTGWPSGGVKTSSGGVGSANFQISVSGNLAAGTFYASLYKRNGAWVYDSGSLRLSDGRSFPIAAPPPGTQLPPAKNSSPH